MKTSPAGTVGLAATLLFTFAAAESVCAQSIRGVLLDHETGRAVSDGTVALMVSGGEQVATTLSDRNGHFVLRAPRAGEFLVYARRLGYSTAMDGPIELGAGETLVVQFRLLLSPIQLDSVAVTAEARVRRLEQAGFYDREKMGAGHFITREDVERKNPIRTTDLLRGVPGVHLKSSDRVPVTLEVTMRGGVSMGALSGGSSACYPRVYLDGMVINPGGSRPAGLDEIVDPMDIEAMEVYRSASEIPIQYGGTQSACGVILVWSR